MSIQWSLVLFTALTGMAGWILALAAADEFAGKLRGIAPTATAVALIFAIVGGVASVTHLAHPERMLGALGHPTSGIFTEAALTGLMSVCAIAYLVLLKRGGSATARKALSILAALFGVTLSFSAGASYMMASIGAWDTPLLPIGYLGTAAAGGACAYVLIGAARGASAEALSLYGRVAAACGVASLAFSVPYVLIAAPSHVGFAVALAALSLGAAAAGFAVSRKPEAALRWASVSFAFALVAVVCFRVTMWLDYDKVIDLFGVII